MKWLALLLLLACGKHEAPPARDLADFDGDQVLNTQEVGSDKYIANIEKLDELSGILVFTESTRTERLVTIRLSNKRDLRKEALKLLAQRKVDNDEHFSEWSKLQLQDVPDIELDEPIYQVELRFETIEEKPTSLYLSHGKNSKRLIAWSPTMVLNISGEELKAILSGEAHFSLTNEWMEKTYYGSASQNEVIQNKTYRVFVHDGDQAQILYVSKILPFQNLQKILDLNEVITIKDQELFTLIGTEERTWWARDLGKEKVLYYGSPQDVSRAFRKGMHSSMNALNRLNGKIQEPLLVNKSNDGHAYFVIRGTKTLRTFQVRKETSKHRRGGGRYWGNETYTCQDTHRAVAKEEQQTLTWKELKSALRLTVDGTPTEINEGTLLRHEVDHDGPFWILGLRNKGKSIALSLQDLPTSNFLPMGIIASTCPERVNRRPPFYSSEGKLQLTIETYVEKSE